MSFELSFFELECRSRIRFVCLPAVLSGPTSTNGGVVPPLNVEMQVRGTSVISLTIKVRRIAIFPRLQFSSSNSKSPGKEKEEENKDIFGELLRGNEGRFVGDEIRARFDSLRGERSSELFGVVHRA